VEPPLLPPARKPPDIIRFAPQRGVRRERLRLEAEEARQRIGNGEPLRLTRVVELPPWSGDGSAAIGPLRQISPAVGEAARTFAPEVPISRLRPPGDASLGPALQPRSPAHAADDEGRAAALLPDGVEVGPPTLVPGSAQPRPRPVRVYTPPPPEPPRVHNEAFAAALVLSGPRELTCDYVGHMAAAKGYGHLRMYRLGRGSRAIEAVPPI